MALKVGLCLLLLTLAMVVSSSSLSFDDTSLAAAGVFPRFDSARIGDWIDEEEEGMMGSEESRRLLAQQQRHISYDALKKNNVPCNKRGQSYYNCSARGKANPYTRGCSYITKCARYTRR